MGKKGSWFTTLRKAFTSNSKDRPANDQLQKSETRSTERKHAKEKKKWGLGKSRDGEHNSFVPLYREPSSIEKILGDEERGQQYKIHQAPPRIDVSPKREIHPLNKQAVVKHEPLSLKKEPSLTENFLLNKEFSPNREDTPQNRENLRDIDVLAQRNEVLAKKATSSKKQEPTLKDVTPSKKVQQLKSHKRKQRVSINDVTISATKIQAAYRGYAARKKYHALKGLIRLQGVMRGQGIKHQTMNALKCMQLLVRVQTQIRSRRLQRMEIIRQQTQTYHLNNKENDSNFTRWSLGPQSEVDEHENWDDSVLTKQEADKRMQRKVEAIIKRERALAYAYSHQLLKVTPKTASAMLTDIRSGGYPMWWSWLERTVGPKPNSNSNASTKPTTINRNSNNNNNQNPPFQSPTPKQPKISFPKPSSQSRISSNRWGVRDDDSLTSCPPFTPVPGYMAPTVSARAKVRDVEPQPQADIRRRFTAALGQSLGSLRWTGRSKDYGSVRGKHRHNGSVSTMSVDSTLSLPAVGFGARKPFK